MLLFLPIKATFFLLFPNLSKIEMQAPDSLILLKPNKKTNENPINHDRILPG